jgi:FAD/FMN-containing dehydrogenase
MNSSLDISSLSQAIQGKVIVAADSTYEQARTSLFNKEARPAAIVQCASPQDVVAALRFATKNKLKVSVRSGGHSGAGLSTNDGGIVIDLAPIASVEIIDETKHIVRIGGGATWLSIAKALAPHNLAISSGDTTTVGIGGLTLGGGMGWMVRGHGLTIDNLVGAEIVTADGKVLHLSDTENPELFWAIRGGGGGFGVVTSFEIRAYPNRGVIGGHIIYPTEKRETILRNWAKYMRTAPEELNTTVVLFPGFGASQTPQLMLLVCHDGDDEQAAQRAIQPLRELGDTPLSDEIKARPYFKMLEDAMDIGGMKVRVRNGFVKSFDNELIAALSEHFGIPNSPVIQIRSLGGAFSRVAEDATAFGHRDSEGFMVMPSFTPASAPEDEANAAADKLWAPLKKFSIGAYANFLTDIRPESVNDAYIPTTRDRLAKLKAQYDPDNTFSLTITPTDEI